MVNNKGNVGAGMYLFTMVVLSLFVLAGLAQGLSGMFSNYGDSVGGILGFMIKYWFVTLLLFLTFMLFVSVSIFRGASA